MGRSKYVEKKKPWRVVKKNKVPCALTVKRTIESMIDEARNGPTVTITVLRRTQKDDWCTHRGRFFAERLFGDYYYYHKVDRLDNGSRLLRMTSQDENVPCILTNGWKNDLSKTPVRCMC